MACPTLRSGQPTGWPERPDSDSRAGIVAGGRPATNKYKDKVSLAYLANRYGDPDIHRFFGARGVTLNDDVMALAELVQWVWRSAIREGKPIKVFVPSARMRWLLKRWLATDDVVALIEELQTPCSPELTLQNLVNENLSH